MTSTVTLPSNSDLSSAAPAGVALHEVLRPWRSLRLLNGYRLGIAALAVVFATVFSGLQVVGDHYPRLFFAVAGLYFGCAVAFVVATRLNWPRFAAQVYTQTVVDLVAVTLLMYASGGISSGLGMLLVINIAAAGMLLGGHTPAVVAVAASLAVLGAEVVTSWIHGTQSNFTQAGLLAATFFSTALIATTLSRRAKDSETLAEQRGVDLANMRQLADYIIQRMQTGIMVVDAAERVRLANESARYLLSVPEFGEPPLLGDISQALLLQLRGWRQGDETEPQAFRPTALTADVLPRFARLGLDDAGGTLIFLEDTAALAQQAQQMKLASLGRLTASIAHEIRNPLGAISHAGQLLAEAQGLAVGDVRLTQIIRDQSQRMNTIIENVLQLSRRDRSKPQEFALLPWVEEFAAEFRRDRQLAEAVLVVDIVPMDMPVRIDPSHLHQVLWNLCDNGLRHSQQQPLPRLLLRGGRGTRERNPYLEVIDNGAGVDPAMVEHIFEPFFTTSGKGTGLGLYIARELCESNQARLNYTSVPGESGCLRITFADPRRRHTV